MATNQVRIRTLSSAPLSSASLIDQQAGPYGDGLVTEFHGRRYEMARNKMLFHCANQAATVTTVGLATTYTGLCLSNPLGSGVNLSVLEVGAAFPVAPAAALVYGLMVGYNGATNVTHTTPAAPKSNYIGVAPTALGLVDVSCTLPTAPWVQRVLGKVDTGAITVDTQAAPILLQTEGSIVLAPGAYVAFFTSTASAAAGFLAHFEWEEVLITA